MTALANRTSPVARGKYVFEVLRDAAAEAAAKRSALERSRSTTKRF